MDCRRTSFLTASERKRAVVGTMTTGEAGAAGAGLGAAATVAAGSFPLAGVAIDTLRAAGAFQARQEREGTVVVATDTSASRAGVGGEAVATTAFCDGAAGRAGASDWMRDGEREQVCDASDASDAIELEVGTGEWCDAAGVCCPLNARPAAARDRAGPASFSATATTPCPSARPSPAGDSCGCCAR